MRFPKDKDPSETEAVPTHRGVFTEAPFSLLLPRTAGRRCSSASLPPVYQLGPLQTPHLTEEAQKQEASHPRLQLKNVLGRGTFKFMGNAPFPLILECAKHIRSSTQALTAAFQLLRPLPPILMYLFNCYARRNLIKLLCIMLWRSSTFLSLQGRCCGPKPDTATESSVFKHTVIRSHAYPLAGDSSEPGSRQDCWDTHQEEYFWLCPGRQQFGGQQDDAAG